MTQYINLWKNAFNFKGVATRSDFWLAMLVNFIAVIVLSVIGSIIETQVLYIIYIVALIIPYIAVVVRRMHDIGKSGFWIFITFVPVIGSIWLLVLLCTASTTEYKAA